jgi:hypothetical protein
MSMGIGQAFRLGNPLPGSVDPGLKSQDLRIVSQCLVNEIFQLQILGKGGPGQQD